MKVIFDPVLGKLRADYPSVGGVTPGDLAAEILARQNGDIALSNRTTILENNEFKILYFQSVSATTGTVALPTNSTIILGDMPYGLSAVVETIVSGKPSGVSATTAGGVAITVSSFDASGNYVLSGTPSGYPVAILYVLKITGKYYSNLTFANIIEAQIVDAASISYVNTQLALKENLITAGSASQYWRGDKTWQTLDKSAVGLGNVDNTSDANKPVSTAQQTALNLKEDAANKGASGGYVGLTLFKINFRNVANTFISFFTNSNTAARTYTFPDKDGTVAMLSDIVPAATTFWLDPVISNSVTAQPGSPVLNDRYLLPGSGLTGASWPGNENKIATFDGSVWVYTTPLAGNVVVVNSLSAPNNQYSYSGTYNTGAWALSSVVNAFLQGGNSFGGTANTGTLDNQDYAIRTNNVVRMIWDKAGTWFASTGLSIGLTNSAANITAAAKSWLSFAASTTTKAQLFFTTGVDVTASLVNGLLWYNGTNLKFRDAAISKSFVFDNDSRGIAKSASFTVAATENGVTYNVTTSTSVITATYPTGVAGFVFYIRKVDSGTGVVITSVASINLTRQFQLVQYAYNGSTWDASILDEGYVPTNSVMANLSGASDYAMEASAVDIHDTTQKAYNYDQNGFTKDWLSGVFFRQFLPKTVSNTTKASIISTTAGDYVGATSNALRVPLFSLVKGKAMVIEIEGKYTSTNVADTLLIEIKIGALTLTSATPFTVGTVYTDNYFKIKFTIACTATGTSGAVVGIGMMTIITGANVTTSFPIVGSFAAQTLDTTIDNDIVVNVQHSAAGGSMTNVCTTLERLA